MLKATFIENCRIVIISIHTNMYIYMSFIWKNFQAQVFLINYHVSQRPDSQLKIAKTPWKIYNIQNYPMTSLIGREGAVWREKNRIKNLVRLSL